MTNPLSKKLARIEGTIHPRHPLLGVVAVMVYTFSTYRCTNNWSGLARRNRRIKTIANYQQAARENVRWQHGWEIASKKIQLLFRTSIFQETYNHRGNCHNDKDYISGYRFHNFTPFLVRDSRLGFEKKEKSLHYREVRTFSLVKGETRIDTLIDHDTHLARFACLHVQLGKQVVRKYVQSGGR